MFPVVPVAHNSHQTYLIPLVVVFGAALANAGELATASLAKAAKELTSAVVMCDNDFVETMASISGVDVVSLLGRFCKVCFLCYHIGFRRLDWKLTLVCNCACQR